jgi:hypothetical protein
MSRRTICVFCGEGPVTLTIEDTLPNWLLEFWRGQDFATGDVTQVYVHLDTGKRETFTAPLKVATPIVCVTCNTGWMSDIQSRASKYLKPMISGERISLDSSAQRWVATWAFMTACTWEFAQPRQNIPKPKRHELKHLRRQPPTSTQVWIGYYQSRHPDTMRSMTSFTFPLDVKAKGDHAVPRGAKAYAATLQFRHLVLQFFGHTLKKGDFYVDRTGAAALFTDIWPTTRRPVPWGRWAMDDAGLEKISLGFLRNPWIDV